MPESKHCIGVGNGLEALVLSLKALGVRAGDEVLVPSNTYIATWLAVSYCGARPVPVEPDERTYNIDPEKIEAAITKHTKGIIPVHLYGQPADTGRIKEIARNTTCGFWKTPRRPTAPATKGSAPAAWETSPDGVFIREKTWRAGRWRSRHHQ